MDPDGSLDLDGLDAALAAGARALVLASPHNPTGRALARDELEAIAERCAEREVVGAGRRDPCPADAARSDA